jgi:steroid 5-alpha reductase family enzyme
MWFVVSLAARRLDVADVAWGFGISLATMVPLVMFSGTNTRVSIIAALVFFWSVRLTLHIFRRLLRSSEDERYRTMRKGWKSLPMARSYVNVFLFQGLLMAVVAYPALHAAFFPSEPLGLFELLGVLVWILGFVLESVSDMQLARFKSNSDNKGRICMTGLWKYSRHPNYLGELCMWWGIGLLVVTVPYGVLALISPVTITTLLLFVSGIPMVEKRAMRDPEYREYARVTPRLFPNLLGRLVKKGAKA